MKSDVLLIVVVFFLLQSCREEDHQVPFQLTGVYAGNTQLPITDSTVDVEQSYVLNLSAPIDISSASEGIRLNTSFGEVTTPLTFYSTAAQKITSAIRHIHL